jgi:hypothetical protein
VNDGLDEPIDDHREQWRSNWARKCIKRRARGKDKKTVKIWLINGGSEEGASVAQRFGWRGNAREWWRTKVIEVGNESEEAESEQTTKSKAEEEKEEEEKRRVRVASVDLDDGRVLVSLMQSGQQTNCEWRQVKGERGRGFGSGVSAGGRRQVDTSKRPKSM